MIVENEHKEKFQSQKKIQSRILKEKKEEQHHLSKINSNNLIKTSNLTLKYNENIFKSTQNLIKNIKEIYIKDKEVFNVDIKNEKLTRKYSISNVPIEEYTTIQQEDLKLIIYNIYEENIQNKFYRGYIFKKNTQELSKFIQYKDEYNFINYFNKYKSKEKKINKIEFIKLEEENISNVIKNLIINQKDFLERVPRTFTVTNNKTGSFRSFDIK